MSFQPESNERPNRHRIPESNNGYGLEKNQPAPSSATEGGLSKILMIALVVLALIASVVTVMTDSQGWMKVAILAALWAAFIGVYLVVRYSSALKNAREQHSLREGEHRAELERERSKAREDLARAESDFAQRAKATRDEQIELLRAEVENLRSQLEGMGAGDLSDQGPRAVRARAERIVELENRNRASAQSARSAAPQSATSASFAAQSAASKAKPQAQPYAGPRTQSGSQSATQRRNSGGFSTGSFAAVRWTGQDTESTAQIPLVVDTSTMNGKAGAGKAEAEPGKNVNAGGSASQTSGNNAASASQRASQTTHAAHSSGQIGSHDPNHRPAHAGATSEGSDQNQASAEGGDAGHRRGRRRAEQGGLTVAELLARSKNQKK